MSLLVSRTARSIATAALLLQIGCFGPTIGIVSNDFSQDRSAEVQAADRAHCEAVAKEVHREYGPFPTDTSFSSASRNMSYRTRYEAACLRVKGYDVAGRLGRQFEPIDLPDSAMAKIRASQDAPK